MCIRDRAYAASATFHERRPIDYRGLKISLVLRGIAQCFVHRKRFTGFDFRPIERSRSQVDVGSPVRIIVLRNGLVFAQANEIRCITLAADNLFDELVIVFVGSRRIVRGDLLLGGHPQNRIAESDDEGDDCAAGKR